MEPRILLASRSPRRRELIKLLGYPVVATSADVDESRITHPDPAVNVVETAVLKAAVIRRRWRPEPTPVRVLLVAADTTVALDGDMLNKPTDANDARRMLLALRDRTHYVHTGVTVIDMATGQTVKGVNSAAVTMRDYTDAEIEAYVASGDPLDKAGAYAIQHLTFRPVSRLDGCFTGVMGLSLCHLLQLLTGFDLPWRVDLAAVHVAHRHYPCPLFPKLTPF